jgi:hypothetical protein
MKAPVHMPRAIRINASSAPSLTVNVPVRRTICPLDSPRPLYSLDSPQIGQSVTAITAGEPAVLDVATTVREQSRRQQMGAIS